jgi:hypothetical protein
MTRTTNSNYCPNQHQLLSTDQETIPAMNSTKTHAEDFVVNKALLLPISTAFAHYTLRDVFSLCVEIEQSVAPTNSKPLAPPHSL